MSKAHTLYQVIRQVRSCFNQLKVLGDELHQDLGITASMRVIMESLADDGEQTVPQIARAKGVSREHIQVNVDELLSSTLITLRDNPAHRRSPFVALTKKGHAAFKEMRGRETKVLELLAHELGSEPLEKTAETLAQLRDSLVKMQVKGGRHG
ncbi:MAG: winged helix-turn-helix transcriptional regulator [Nitrospira sp.]|nr:winged helix-turn-helix transcriptional regulator [Nitrospira sp.]